MHVLFEPSFNCSLAEAIEVDVEFKNPLQISIPLTNVSLISELSERSEEAETGNYVIHRYIDVHAEYYMNIYYNLPAHVTAKQMQKLLVSFRMIRTLI